MLKVICFDLGGVLVRICRSWAEAVAAAGLPERGLVESSEPDAIQRRFAVVDAYQTGRLVCEEYYAALSGAVAGVYSADEVRRIHGAWVLGEYPGVADLVAALNAHEGLVTACLSNVNHAHWSRLNEDGEGDYPSIPRLRIRLASHLLGAIKPDRRIFELAQQHFDCRPDQVCFFDDLEDNVRAARAAHWNAEHIDHAGDPVAQVRGHLERYGLRL